MRSIQIQTVVATTDDADLVRRALDRDGGAFRIIMETHNRKLYRIARSILRNDGEAEDAVQESYVRAFTNLGGFRGESSLSTWLSRIVVNEALGRLRSRHTAVPLDIEGTDRTQAEIIRFPSAGGNDDPERALAQRQILRLVEQATDNLPEVYRTVFVARVIEGMSVEETATLLSLRPETVKTRLYRARRLVKEQLNKQLGAVLMDAFPFAGRRCARMTACVLTRLGLAA